MKPLVSVIVPIYNVEKYLSKCVETILNQTYKNIEIILVDDGANDASPEICDAFSKKDQRIKVIHKQNGGLSDARNTGIKIAQGEYFAFIDSDDYVAPDFIETLLDICVKNNAEIAQCKSKDVFDDNGDELQLNDATDIEVLSNLDMIKRIYQDNGVETIVIWSKLYKRELFDDIRFPVGKLHEDEFTDYKLFDKCTKIAIANKVLYYYRVNMQSIVRSKYNLRRLDIFEALKERLEYFKAKGYDELLSLTEAAYVKQLLIHIPNLKNYDKNSLRLKSMKAELKEKFFKVIADKNVPESYKLLLLRMRYTFWFEKMIKKHSK